MQTILVWHRRDLRVHDNAALYHAAKNGIPQPLFIIDPFFFRQNNETCPDRILFMFECLKDLDNEYKKRGSRLALLFGNSIEVIQQLQQQHNALVYYNQDTNMPFGLERDKQVKNNEAFKGFTNDAIVRHQAYDRANWHDHCKLYFQSAQYTAPKNLPTNNIASTTTIQEILKKYNIKSEKSKVPKGGENAGLQRLEEFGAILKQYPGSISKPLKAETNTSRISAHFSLGSVSLKTVYQYIQSLPLSQKTKSFYITRLYWNQHFTQKMQDFPDLPNKPVNPIFEQHYDELYQYDEQKVQAWKQGKTGYPLVDASMRALVQTGFINFRMRAMVASFLTYTLKQPWKIGADFMHYHLIDADTAINYAQWQMQAGLVGIHPNRIYNPTKQIGDNDPECLFIKTYVEELQKVSPDEIKTEPDTQQQTLIQRPYQSPIVNFKKEADITRATFTKINSLARAKLYGDPAILQRASLSGRARQRHNKKEPTQTKIV